MKPFNLRLGKCERCKKRQATKPVTATLKRRSYQLCDKCCEEWRKIWRSKVDNQTNSGKYYKGYEERFEEEFQIFLVGKVRVMLI